MHLQLRGTEPLIHLTQLQMFNQGLDWTPSCHSQIRKKNDEEREKERGRERKKKVQKKKKIKPVKSIRGKNIYITLLRMSDQEPDCWV